MTSRIDRIGPWLLGVLLVLGLSAPVLDPGVQLYFRDTGRIFYPFKQFIAAELRAGRWPVWDPWTEAGTSIFGQVSPALLHPFTLLYLAFPFELAFKLNHLLCFVLAYASAYLLARRADAGSWPATAAACAYAGSGYLLSMVAGNLQYATGAASLPLALHALLRARDQATGPRVLWAAAALAACVIGGEPQSAVLAVGIGAVWIVAEGPARRRAIALAAAWAICGVLLSMPAIVPALPNLARSARASGPRFSEQFANTGPRLLGFLAPRAFDDDLERRGATESAPFGEYFAPRWPISAFADSICLGAPALLLALGGARRRRGVWFLAGGALFLAASTGIFTPLLSRTPLGLFQYPEKYVGPASLLFALAVSQSALDGKRLAGAAAVALALGRLVLPLAAPALRGFLVARGRLHSVPAADAFIDALGWSLLVSAIFSAASFLAATVRLPALAATTVAAFTLFTGRLPTVPLELFHAPSELAARMVGRAGPSAGRWRLRTDGELVPAFGRFDARVGTFVAQLQLLVPQLHALAGIEGASSHAALPDADAEAASQRAAPSFNKLLGIRFHLRDGGKELEKLGYEPAVLGWWMKELPERPRAFLVGCVRTAVGREEAVALLARTDVERAVVLRRPLELPCPAAGTATTARPLPARIEVRTAADAATLLVVAEHFDEGWRAEVDGAPAPVLQADLVALGVPLPPGAHDVVLRYAPPRLWLGLSIALATAVILAALGRRRPRWSRQSQTSSTAPP